MRRIDRTFNVGDEARIFSPPFSSGGIPSLTSPLSEFQEQDGARSPTPSSEGLQFFQQDEISQQVFLSNLFALNYLGDRPVKGDLRLFVQYLPRRVVRLGSII